MSGLTAELVVSRSVRDTAAVLEWVSDPPPGEPYVAPARDALLRGGGGRRSRAGSAWASAPSRSAGGSTPTPSAWPRPRRPGGCSSRSATRSSRPTRDVLDDERYIPQFLVRWSAGVDWNLRYWSAQPGREIGPGRRGAAHLGAGRDGPLAQRGRVPARRGVRPVGHAPGRRVVGRRLRPAAHAHARPAAAAARLLRGRRGEPADADRDRHAGGRVHGRASTPPASRRSRCRSTRASRACRSACSWWPPTVARTCSCGWRRSSRRPRPWADRTPPIFAGAPAAD